MQIGSHVVDFACLHAGLIIEVDGATHGGAVAQSNDAARDNYLCGRGFQVLRFTNDDIMANPEGVYTVIANVLSGRRNNYSVAPPSPTLPAGGRVSTEPAAPQVPNSPESP